MDPLSHLLSMLKVRAARCTRFEASGQWAYRFPAKSSVKFAAVIRGACWIDFGAGARHQLEAGDAFLLANSPDYVLANDASAFPADGIATFNWEESDVARHGGDDTILVAGRFSFDAADAELLLGALPRFLLLPRQHASAAVISATLHMIAPEIGGARIGAAILTDRLVDVLLVQVLRAALDLEGSRERGWIAALADPRIGRALELMHDDVAHRWSLQDLCSAVAMSRSAFSSRFRALVGQSPLDYLLHWRMRIAREALRQGTSVASVAQVVGYASESAFRHAYKRVYGQPPARQR